MHSKAKSSKKSINIMISSTFVHCCKTKMIQKYNYTTTDRVQDSCSQTDTAESTRKHQRRV